MDIDLMTIKFFLLDYVLWDAYVILEMFGHILTFFIFYM
jgi:hypothetical protein